MRIAVFQMTSGISPEVNAASIVAAAAEAASGGAVMLFTPEMSGLLDRNRDRARGNIQSEASDRVLAAVREAARTHGLWIALGSLALAGERADGRLVNRSFMIDAEGNICARYDKMHLFDVDLPTGESWHESALYAPGTRAIIASTPLGEIGLSVCYDLRFPALYAALTDHGASVLSIPAAFTVPTGKAHWHVMQRARAIESAAFVVAAAQTGQHEDGRSTYGHSLVVDPWGDVLLDMGPEPGVAFCDLNLDRVNEVRRQIPVLTHRRAVTVDAP